MHAEADPNNLHRTAKYFMDSGRVESADAAVGILKSFGLSICVGKEILTSPDHQTALITLVNCASRTLLGGIEIVRLPSARCTSVLGRQRDITAEVRAMGAKIVPEQSSNWPCAVIGSANPVENGLPAWRLTWEGWRGGVVPYRENASLAENESVAIAPALAAGICAAEAFSFHAGDHPMTGRRSSGLSLWRPSFDWLLADPSEPVLAYLPSRLWIIGLGNLGQAYAWLLGCLPYSADAAPLFVLQDFDCINASNESTSLLTRPHDVGKKKARVVAEWLEARGFKTIIEERRFGPWIHRMADEPGAALCGVDNALARSSLEKAGFDLIVEAGLGAGPQGFRDFSLHTFPATRAAEEIWSEHTSAPDVQDMPAYQALRRSGVDQCGVAQLASRSVAVPFVGLTAACLVVAELLRRLNGGEAIELASLGLLALSDAEIVPIQAPIYAFGHVAAADRGIAMTSLAL